MKRIVLLFFAVLCLLTSCETMNSAKNEVVGWFDSTESDEYKALQNKYDKLEQDIQSIENEYSSLADRYNSLVNKYNSLLNEYESIEYSYGRESSLASERDAIIDRAKDAVRKLKRDFNSFQNGWCDTYDIERDIKTIENNLDGWL